MKKPKFEHLKNNMLKVYISGVNEKDLDILCDRYDIIRRTYTITPQVIEVHLGNNKRGVKKVVTLYYLALPDSEIGKLQKLHPQRTYHAVKNLFSHIQDIFHLPAVDKNQHKEHKNRSRHLLYREYMNVKK